MVGNSDDETNFPRKLLLTNKSIVKLHKGLANYYWTDIKLPKTQLSKIIQPGRFLGRLRDPLLKTGLPLMKIVIKQLAESVLILSGLIIAASILGSRSTPLIISDEEMGGIMKIFKCLEDSGLLLKGVSEAIQN